MLAAAGLLTALALLAACGGGPDADPDAQAAAAVRPATALPSAMPAAARDDALATAATAMQPLRIDLAPDAPPLPEGLQAASPVFRVGTDGQAVREPLEVTLPVDAARLAGRPPALLRQGADGRWEPAPAPAWRTPPGARRPGATDAQAPAPTATALTSMPGAVVVVAQPDAVPGGMPTVQARAFVGDEELTVPGEPSYVTTRAIVEPSTLRIVFDIVDGTRGGGIERVAVWQAVTRLDVDRPRVAWTEAGDAVRTAGRRRNGRWEFQVALADVSANGVYWFRGVATNVRGGVGIHEWPVLVEVRIPRPPRETLFIEANRYPAPLPDGATALSRDAFRALFEAGELQLLTAATLAEQAALPQARYDAHVAAAQAMSDRPAALQALLDEALAHPAADGDRVTTLPGGQTVTLLGRASALASVLAATERSRTADSARAHYSALYRALPSTMRSGLADPATLADADADSVRAAIAALVPRIADVPNLDNARWQPPPPAATRTPGRERVASVLPGNGGDTDICPGGPTGLYANYWWPLRDFVPPVRNQGNRGTCWSFAATGVLETRERVYRDAVVDLSEQFLVNRYKAAWVPDAFNEGGGGHVALNSARDRSQQLPAESFWTYNRSNGRTVTGSGATAAYVNSCAGYSGTCGDSAHQSEVVCAAGVCATRSPSFAGPGLTPDRVDPIWIRGDAKLPWNLESMRLALAAGWSLIADMPVHIGFDEAVRGYVTDYAASTRDMAGNVVPGSRGNHVVQIVGFLPNEVLVWPGQPVPDNGGGMFVVRNSWGCGAGDGGFWYVPARYVQELFHAVYVMTTPGARSTRWADAQRVPGGTTPLSLTVTPTTTVDDFRTVDLASLITVAHPQASTVTLTVTSARKGLLYQGQWNVLGKSGLFGNNLRYTPVPSTAGALAARDDLTVTARWGTQVASAAMQVFVLAPPPPTVTLSAEGTPREGDGTPMRAQIAFGIDDPSVLCSRTSWTVSAPDGVSSGTGCQTTVTFGTPGPRTVSVTTRDFDDRAGTASMTLSVLPPLDNPYPRLLSAALLSREVASPTLRFCMLRTVPNDRLIDLRNAPCSDSIFNPPPSRYVGSAEVQNPTGEALAYDWTVTVRSTLPGFPPLRQYTERTTTPEFNWLPVPVAAENTAYPCELRLTVVAPEATRNKSRTVWSGPCINLYRGPS